MKTILTLKFPSFFCPTKLTPYSTNFVLLRRTRKPKNSLKRVIKCPKTYSYLDIKENTKKSRYLSLRKAQIIPPMKYQKRVPFNSRKFGGLNIKGGKVILIKYCSGLFLKHYLRLCLIRIGWAV